MLISPRSKYVCSAYLAFEDYRQFDVSINDHNEQENVEEELEQVEFNDLNDSETIELIKTIKKVSNLLQNRTWSSLPLPVRIALSSISGQIGKTLNRTLHEDTKEVSGECKNISFLKNINASHW